MSGSRRAGFSLVELLVAVVISALVLAVASSFARTVFMASGKRRVQSDFQERRQMIGRQLRDDLRQTGVGSTGALAVNPQDVTAPGFWFNTPLGGFPAVSVLVGANNLVGETAAGVPIVERSDAIQLVVPNGATVQQTTAIAPAGNAVLWVADSTVYQGCAWLYITDYSSPGGLGRVQLALFSGSSPPNTINLNRPLLFTVNSGSDVMCARLSTYYLTTDGWFRRNDLMDPNSFQPLRLNSGVFVDTSQVGADRVIAGVFDFQVAYRVSSELFRPNPAPTDEEAQWLYNGRGYPDPPMATRAAWFEIREARAHLQMRTLRKIQPGGGMQTIGRGEDGGAPFLISRNHSVDMMFTAEPLMNLKFFDQGAPAGTSAEPY